jgi:hypothetical protein
LLMFSFIPEVYIQQSTTVSILLRVELSSHIYLPSHRARIDFEPTVKSKGYIFMSIFYSFALGSLYKSFQE